MSTVAAAVPRAALPPMQTGLATVRTPAWLLLLWGGALLATFGFMVIAGLDYGTIVFLTAVVFLGVGTAAVRMLVRTDPLWASRLFAGAFLARYIAALVVNGAVLLSGLPGLQGGKDYIAWEAGGWSVAEAWRGGTYAVYLIDSDPGYYYLIGAVYTITGRYPVAPILLNALFGAGAAVVVFGLAARLFDRRTAVIASLLAAFLPTLLVWSSMMYKDTILAFFVTATMAAALEVYRNASQRAMVLLAMSLLPLFLIRPQTAMTLVGAVTLLIALTGQRRGRKIAGLAAAGAVLLLALVVLQAAGFAGRLDLMTKFSNPLAAVMSARETWADEVGATATGFSRFLYGKNLLLSPHLLVVAMVLPFIIPLPGTAGFEMSIPSFLMPGQVLWLLLLPALAFGVLRALRLRTAPMVFMVGVVFALVLGVALAGYFSNPRYLVQGVPLMLVLAASGLGDVRRRLIPYLSMLLAVVVVFCLYGMARGM